MLSSRWAGPGRLAVHRRPTGTAFSCSRCITLHETKCAAASQRKSDRELSKNGAWRTCPGSGKGDSALDTDPGARPGQASTGFSLRLPQPGLAPAGPSRAAGGPCTGASRATTALPESAQPSSPPDHPAPGTSGYNRGASPCKNSPGGSGPPTAAPTEEAEEERPRRKEREGPRSAGWGVQGPRGGSGDPEGCLSAEGRRRSVRWG